MTELTPLPPQRRRPPRRRALRSGFLAGVARTLAIVLTFVGSGVVAGSLAGGGPAQGDAAPAHEPRASEARPAAPLRYLGPRMEEPAAEPRVWLVDGFNALHVALLRGRDRHAWWRSEERERLVAQVAGFEAGDAEVVVVFDGPRPAAEEGSPAGPRVVFAPSADEWLLREIRRATDPAEVALVTADRRLADRARHRGAQVVSPRAFLERCSGPGDPSRSI